MGSHFENDRAYSKVPVAIRDLVLSLVEHNGSRIIFRYASSFIWTVSTNNGISVSKQQLKSRK